MTYKKYDWDDIRYKWPKKKIISFIAKKLKSLDKHELTDMAAELYNDVW